VPGNPLRGNSEPARFARSAFTDDCEGFQDHGHLG